MTMIYSIWVGFGLMTEMQMLCGLFFLVINVWCAIGLFGCLQLGCAKAHGEA